MGKMITLQPAGSTRIAAYRADPPGTPRGGLVVVQEIFGVLQVRNAAGGLDLLAVRHMLHHEGNVLAGRTAAGKARGGLDVVGVRIGDDLAELDLLFVGEQAGLDDDL